jgi:hypothetical protein
MPGDFSQRLKRVLSPHRTEQDGCNICVLYGAERARARISLGGPRLAGAAAAPAGGPRSRLLRPARDGPAAVHQR